jgi:hypothetical protein
MATMCLPDGTVDVGTAEIYADAICADLCSLTVADTLSVISAEAGDCIQASAAMIAGAVAGQPDEASVTLLAVSITAEWEG